MQSIEQNILLKIMCDELLFLEFKKKKKIVKAQWCNTPVNMKLKLTF